MSRADEVSLRIANRSALAAGNGHELPLGELNSLAAERRNDGKIWYCSGLWFQFADTFDTGSNQTGVTQGRRLHEFVSQIELSSPLWPDRTIIRASGRALRQRSIMIAGKLPAADPANTTDADASVTDQRRVIYVPFRRPSSAYKGEDFAIPLAAFRDASLLLDLNGTPVTGVTLTNTDVIVRANLIALPPRQVSFWRFVERAPVNDAAFDWPIVGGAVDAFVAAWMHLTGTRSADQNENQFEETTTVRLRVGGEMILDGRMTFQDLIEDYNASLSDAAAEESATAPLIMPLLRYGQGQKSTKLHSGQGRPHFEASATLGGTTGNGTGAAPRLLTEEILPGVVGSFEAQKFARGLGARGVVEYALDAADKKPVRNVAVASRLPKKIHPVAPPPGLRPAIAVQRRIGLARAVRARRGLFR